MKILITGGAGFIGSHVAERLLHRGDQILVIDNFATGRHNNLKTHNQLKLIEGSIAEKGLVDKIFNEFKPNLVVHAAASYKDPQNWEEDARTNVAGSVYVTQASRRHGIQRLIYFQTALCYGLHPTEQPIPLNHPLRPEASSYAISKTAAENYIRLSGLNFISFRLANAYGPRNVSGPLPTFFQRLTQRKPCFVMDTRRDFIFINDLVDVVMKALDGKGQTGIYHVSSGRDFSIRELFDSCVKSLGIHLEKEVEVRPRNPDDAYTILLDPSVTIKEFQWTATTPLASGVQSAVDWYRTHGITETFTHLSALDKQS